MFRCNPDETEYALRVVTTKNSKAAVVGASGYVGEELVRLLLAHPHVDLAAVTSRQFAGKPLAQIFPRLMHYDKVRSLNFFNAGPKRLGRRPGVRFLALPHRPWAELS